MTTTIRGIPQMMFILACGFCLDGVDAHAQRVRGTVVDTLGTTIENVTVRFQGSGRSDTLTVISDSAGQFAVLLPRVIRYQITAERLGYAIVGPEEIRTVEGEEVELRIVMGESAVPLPAVQVVGRRRIQVGTQQIYDRIERMRQLGVGRALTRADIDRLPAQTVGTIVSTMSGRIRALDSPQLIVNTILIRDGTFRNGHCAPAIYVDGFRVNQRPTNVNMLIEPRHVEAVELYVGAAQTPLGFHDPAGCGSVLIWSRRGSAQDGKPHTWVRLGVAAILVAGALIAFR